MYHTCPKTSRFVFSIPRHRLDAQDFAKASHYFAVCGVSPLGFLAVDEGIVGGHLKPSATGREQCEALDEGREIFEDFGRRTDGAGRVVSLYAVFDAHRILLHNFLLGNGLPGHAGETGKGSIKNVAHFDYTRLSELAQLPRCGTHTERFSFRERWFDLSPFLLSDIVWLCQTRRKTLFLCRERPTV